MADSNILDKLQGMTPDQVLQLLQTEGLTETDVRNIMSFAEGRANTGNAEVAHQWSQVYDAANKGQSQVHHIDQIKDQLAQQVAGLIAQATVSGQAPDFTKLADQLPPTLSRTDRAKAAAEIMKKGEDQYTQQRTTQLTSQGVDADTANTQAQNEASLAGGSSDATPRWILQAVGAPLTQDQKDRITQYWNDYYGTNFTNFDRDVAPLMPGATPNGVPKAAQDIVTGALLAQEPEIAMKVMLPNGKPQVLSVPQMQVLREKYGMDNDAISRIVRLTSMQATGFDNIGQVNFQPMVALLAAKGQLQVYSDLQKQQETRDRGAQAMAAAPEGKDGQQAAIAKAKGALSSPDLTQSVFPNANQSGADVAAHPGEPGSLTDILTNPIQKAINATRTDINQTPGRMNVVQLQNEYDEGLKRFNSNPTLAFLYALDHGLAERIAQSGGDPAKLSGSDNAKAMKYLNDGGLVSAGSTPFEQMGGASGDAVLRQLSDYFQSYGDPSKTQDQRQLPDPAAVSQSLTDLWRATFRTDPSQQLKDAFQQELTRITAETDPNQTIDVTARIQDFIRQQPLYQQLYKNNNTGLSDQQYQTMFEQGVSSILGNEQDNGSVLAGMRSGDYQTSVFSAATSKEAQNNSTWQERLAQAANTVAKNT